jgi:FAD/FMN-containing dehydrogenase
VARGSGTSLSGGSLPVAGGVVIALNRLNRVLSIDPDGRTAVGQPGCINLAISAAAAPHGLAYAPDPSSQSVCTIGGNVAFNSGGAHCLRYGMTSNHVLGIRAVLPDGELVELGGASTEPVGPDWTGMFCGSEGLFGIALEVTVRLVAVAEAVHAALAVYPSLEAAGEARWPRSSPRGCCRWRWRSLHAFPEGVAAAWRRHRGKHGPFDDRGEAVRSLALPRLAYLVLFCATVAGMASVLSVGARLAVWLAITGGLMVAVAVAVALGSSASNNATTGEPRSSWPAQKARPTRKHDAPSNVPRSADKRR